LEERKRANERAGRARVKRAAERAGRTRDLQGNGAEEH